ncbi:hypothetical protein BJV82DRAFT_677388 [Fennellomyces sp. T-0311]|nr:hypothetical protein BJV82DRAFT_677388 [Fennellomyces sp. T-0311]
MPYQNWNNRADTAALFHWYSLENSMEVIEEMRQHILRNHDYTMYLPAKQFALVPIRSPFSLSKRFPPDKLYVCEAIGGWGKLITQVTLYAYFLAYPSKTCPIYIAVDETIGEIEVELLRRINNIIKKLNAEDNDVFYQAKFEDRYGIEWNTMLDDELVL